MTHLASAVLWEILLRRQPKLEQLQSELAAVSDDGGTSFCANRLWYIHYEPQLKRLVGKGAEANDPLLLMPEAYELSRQTLYKLLPPCRDCICIPW